MLTMDRIRSEWARASTFSADKEGVYPDHVEAQEFDKHAGKFVLEYGCGGGSDAMSYLRRGCDVTYVDVVQTNVNTATARIHQCDLSQKAHGIWLQDSASIPLPSSLFDVASSHGVIHHIPEPIPVLQEIRRLIKKGGLFYCMLYTEVLRARHADTMTRLMDQMRLTEEEAFCWCTDGKGAPYAVHYTEETGTQLLSAAGFAVDRMFVYNSHEFRTFRAVAT